MRLNKKNIVLLIAILMGISMFAFDFFWSINEDFLVLVAVIGIVISVSCLLYIDRKVKSKK